MTRPLLVVTPSLHRGGAERHAVRVATALDPTRWRPHVLALADGPLRDELTAAGTPVEVVPVPGGIAGLRAAAAAVRDAIDRIGPAAVSGHNVVVEVVTRLALCSRPLPNVVWKHTCGHIGYRGLRERLFERATGGTVTRYGAVCHTQVRYLVDELGLPPHRISVVGNAVPVPATAPPAPPRSGPPTVLMAAAMRADKDHALVLRAWPSVLARHPRARLRLAGDGPCRADLQRLAAELGIAEHVEFLGVRHDVNALLAEAHLLVLASYTVECCPYAVLEAMAAARGVVATAVGGLPELVEDGVTGRLVPPRDPAALAAALVEGLGTATAWGRAGWRKASRVHPLDHWADRVADLFDEVAGSSPTPAVAAADPVAAVR